jgi:hypothetical protein
MKLLMTEEVDKDNIREMVFAAVFKGDDVMTMNLFAIEERVSTVIAEIVVTMSKRLVLGRQVGCFASIALLPVELKRRVIGGRSAFDHDMASDANPAKAGSQHFFRENPR